MKILIVTAHPDDIEFGFGATLWQLCQQKENQIVALIMSDSMTIEENIGYDLRKEAQDSLVNIYNISIILKTFPTMYFREHFQEIRNVIWEKKKQFRPDIIYCTSPMSSHPDHQVIGEACDSIFLESTIYCFEDLRGNQKQLVNKWNVVSEEDLSVKLNSVGCYKSQKAKAYTSLEGITSLARSRGLQVGQKYAEAFEVMREVAKIL